mmetsp:Transcript_19768/g.46100  ORF Transcript_19768/g.46100 Transcript_19768/m.46100 type:complete len:241 (-) Transcript_19768:734-1456(-)
MRCSTCRGAGGRHGGYQPFHFHRGCDCGCKGCRALKGSAKVCIGPSKLALGRHCHLWCAGLWPQGFAARVDFATASAAAPFPVLSEHPPTGTSGLAAGPSPARGTVLQRQPDCVSQTPVSVGYSPLDDADLRGAVCWASCGDEPKGPRGFDGPGGRGSGTPIFPGAETNHAIPWQDGIIHFPPTMPHARTWRHPLRVDDETPWRTGAPSVAVGLCRLLRQCRHAGGSRDLQQVHDEHVLS